MVVWVKVLNKNPRKQDSFHFFILSQKNETKDLPVTMKIDNFSGIYWTKYCTISHDLWLILCKNMHYTTVSPLKETKILLINQLHSFYNIAVDFPAR